MEASEYKELVFGMLFLKRMSDLFDQEREQKSITLKAKGLRPDAIEKKLHSPDEYTFFVPELARWDKIRHLKSNVGSKLNVALGALEDANIETLENVLKGINFLKKIGKNTLDDDTLADFIQSFEKMTCPP